MIEQPEAKNDLFKFVSKCVNETENKENRQLLQRRFGLDRSLMYITKAKLAEAKVVFNDYINPFLTEWASQNELSARHSKQQLALLKRVAQAGKFHSALKSKFNRKALISRWEQDDNLTFFSSLQDCDDLYRDRALYLRHLQREYDYEEAVKVMAKNDLNLARECNSRNCYEMTALKLDLVKKKLKELPETSELRTEYELLYSDTVALKTKWSQEKKVGEHFNVLIRFLMMADEKKQSQYYIGSKTKLLEAAEERLLALEDQNVEDIKKMLSKNEKIFYFEKTLAKGAINVTEIRANVVNQIVHNLNSSSNNLNGNQWLELSNYCRRLIDEFGDTNASVMKTAISSHFKSMTMGSLRARQLFPNWMTSCEELNPKLVKHFQTELLSVETWMFLPWTSQLLSQVSGDNNHVLYPLVVRMAEEHPDYLKFPYQLSRVTNSDSKLDQILKLGPLTKKLMSALESVMLPQICVLDVIKQSGKTLEPALESLKEKFISSQDLYGVVYRKFAEKCLKTTKVKDKNKFRVNINEFTKREKISNNLGEYVPFLKEFHASNYNEDIFIPGQNMEFQNPKFFHRQKLMCFSNEIRVFNSLRKPINITMISDVGKRFDFIVKCGEDLRQDERIEQVYKVANQAFKSSGLEELKIKTYSVSIKYLDFGFR